MAVPTHLFVEGADFLKRAELTELVISCQDDRVVLTVGVPYDVRMTPAEAEVLAVILTNASKAIRQ